MITIDDFHKLEIRIGHILSAEKVPGTDKLLKLSVDMGLKPSALADGSPDHSDGRNGLGERDIRTVVSGIALYFPDPQELVGKKVAFAANLEPRTIRGIESNGMILAASTEDGIFSLLEARAAIPAGAKIK